MRVLLRRVFVPSILSLASAAVPASAQNAPDGGLPPRAATPPTPAAPTTPTTDAAGPPGQTPPNDERARFLEFDKLGVQGLSSDFPGVGETILRDTGGFRSWLYGRNLYFRGLSSNNLSYDVLQDNRGTGGQQYTGQKLTATQSNDLRLSWKIGGSGNDITQINLSGLVNVTSWRAVGPSGAKISMLNVYHSFGDRRVETKVGFGQNISEFAGIFAGGNPILANGLAASIPISTGMSGGTATAPSAIVQVNPGKGFYAKSAIQRSLVPEGMTADAAGAGLGLKISRRGARPLFIQEFGLRRAAGNGGRKLWVRGGGSYNLTDYARLDRNGERRNWSLYALADYQLFQPDRERAYRGIFVGASALFAPGEVNVYRRSLEARVYALGMIPGRPTDQMTLTAGQNIFSRTLGNAIEATGGTAHRRQFSLGALYAFHASHGIFISPSVNYIRNPSIGGTLKPALNVATGVTLLF